MSANEVCGPRMAEAVPEVSFAEHFLPLLRAHPEGNIIQIDGETGRTETSAQLLRKSLAVCNGLQRMGHGHDDVFCLLAKNSNDVYAAALGVLWLGGVLAPLNPDWKTGELKPLFENVLKPTVVICDEDVVPKVKALVAGSRTKLVVLSESKRVSDDDDVVWIQDLFRVAAEGYVPKPCPASKTAIIIPTSGTTGFPKGVAITHGNLVFQALSMKYHKIEYGHEIGLVLSHMYWITAVLSLLVSLSTGMTRVYLRNINPENVFRAVRKFRPQWTLMSPPLFSALLNAPGFEALSGLKILQLGGNPVTASLQEKIRRKWTFDVAIVNTYGTSETTGIVARTKLGAPLLSPCYVSAELKVKIVDPETGRALERGHMGEIAVRTPATMKGYVGNEEATREVVTEDGWCRTGDLGYFDDGDGLFIVDRLKELIKSVHGQVTPTEVESAIEGLAGVVEAGVVGMLSDTEDCYLVALVVKEGAIAEEDVVNHVRERLSVGKQVREVRFVDHIPRTSVGKINRKELKETAARLFRGTK